MRVIHKAVRTEIQFLMKRLKFILSIQLERIVIKNKYCAFSQQKLASHKTCIRIAKLMFVPYHSLLLLTVISPLSKTTDRTFLEVFWQKRKVHSLIFILHWFRLRVNRRSKRILTISRQGIRGLTTTQNKRKYSQTACTVILLPLIWNLHMFRTG